MGKDNGERRVSAAADCRAGILDRANHGDLSWSSDGRREAGIAVAPAAMVATVVKAKRQQYLIDDAYAAGIAALKGKKRKHNEVDQTLQYKEVRDVPPVAGSAPGSRHDHGREGDERIEEKHWKWKLLKRSRA